MEYDADTWIKSVQVGSMVCNCKSQHRRVVEILHEDFLPKVSLRSLLYFGLLDWLIDRLPEKVGEHLPRLALPYAWADWLSIKYEDLCERFGWVDLYDKTVLLANGEQYSLRPCCCPPEWCYENAPGHEEFP